MNLNPSREVRVDNRQSFLIAGSGTYRCRGRPSFFSASLYLADRHWKSALALLFLIAFFLSLGLLVYGGGSRSLLARLAGALPLRQLLRFVACRRMGSEPVAMSVPLSGYARRGLAVRSTDPKTLHES